MTCHSRRERTATATARADPGAHVPWLDAEVVLAANALAVLHAAAPLQRAAWLITSPRTDQRCST
ncbi:hypothetical protein ACIP6X_20445 [Streptomyces coeruleorubidus]|jgi:hypothetical protein|uniref:hypothetical protein n=1 Tax=Streptomyces coeruleorubidus TaxID=116188 RepID=UPI00380578EC